MTTPVPTPGPHRVPPLTPSPTADLPPVAVDAVRRGDALVLRLTGASTQAERDQLAGLAEASLPGVPVLVIDGTRVGVHVVRGGA